MINDVEIIINVFKSTLIVYILFIFNKFIPLKLTEWSKIKVKLTDSFFSFRGAPFESKFETIDLSPVLAAVCRGVSP